MSALPLKNLFSAINQSTQHSKMPTTVAAQHQPPRPLPSLPSEDICFLHPGYAGYNLLLTLPRVDRTTISTYGVYHRTALLACQIIAGNVFNNSYFTLDKAGQQRAQVLLDGILTDNEYYFIVEGLGKNSSPFQQLLLTL